MAALELEPRLISHEAKTQEILKKLAMLLRQKKITAFVDSKNEPLRKTAISKKGKAFSNSNVNEHAHESHSDDVDLDRLLSELKKCEFDAKDVSSKIKANVKNLGIYQLQELV